MKIIALLLFLLFSPTIWAKTIVASIEEITGKGFLLKHKDSHSNFKATPFTFLYQGDIISLDNKNSTMTIIYNDGKLETINAKNTPYSVHDSKAEESHIINKIQNEAQQWLSQLWVDQIEFSPMQTQGNTKKNSKLYSLFNGEKLKLRQHKQLHLSWYGGQPPFSVKLYKGGKIIASKTDIQSDKLVTEISLRQTLNSGEYQVIIEDHNNNKQIGNIDVVKAMPLFTSKEKKELKNSNITPEKYDTLLALWLIHKSQKFALEAYQLVAEVKDYQPALLVKHGLSSGNLPILK